MSVMTVLGPIDGEQLGVTLMHEHLLIDVSYKWQQPTEVTLRALADPITMPIGLLGRNTAQSDQLTPGRVDTAVARHWLKRDGGTRVDVHRWASPRPARPARHRTAIRVTWGRHCYYLARSIPAGVKHEYRSVADEMLARFATDGKWHPAGIIGELARERCMWDKRGRDAPDEQKVRRAAAAPDRTGLR